MMLPLLFIPVFSTYETASTIHSKKQLLCRKQLLFLSNMLGKSYNKVLAAITKSITPLMMVPN